MSPGPPTHSPQWTTWALTLDTYHLYHATRAELLRALGRAEEARHADERALMGTANPAEQSLLRQRLSWT